MRRFFFKARDFNFFDLCVAAAAAACVFHVDNLIVGVALAAMIIFIGTAISVRCERGRIF